MKPILFLQFRTDQSLSHEQVCINQILADSNVQIQYHNVLDPHSRVLEPSDLSNYQAVISGGSGEFNITDWPKSIQLKITPYEKIFTTLVNSNIPTLAICFAHQLTANIFGGSVVRDHTQAESGTHQITLTNHGTRSALYNNIPTKFFVVEGHKDSVISLPQKATLLATSQNCINQSYQLGLNFFAVQFHPELDKQSLLHRLQMYPEYLHTTNQSLEEIANNFSPIPEAKKIITNFIKIANTN